MKVSIIIPYRVFGKYIGKCLEGLSKLDFKDFEVILLPDEKSEEDEKKYKVIETGEVKPSRKRNLGVKESKGEVLAFLDDDACPHKDWLKNAVKYFRDDKIGIVGGPNLIPKNSNIWEKVSGDVLSMFICSGKAAIRYKISKGGRKFVDELPSCNLLIRREDFIDFDESLLTAEDTKLCFQVKDERNKKILYAPDVIVYHHRRDSFYKHLEQIFIYGRDISLLLKKRFSFSKLYYSLLSLWVVFLLIGGIVSYFSEILRYIYFGIILFYLVVIFLNSILKNLKRGLLIFIIVILTHISYGLGFVYGLLKK